MPDLRESQMSMARFLRNPESAPAPAGVEPRRMKIYRDLIYNNIEGFISGGFPVLRSLYAEADWHALVRSFIDGHRCHTPYFLEISQEFLRFLMEEHQVREIDPPFLAELAHYEWVELALDVSTEEHGPPGEASDILAQVPGLSPLAWVLSYRYPVHRIGPSWQPEEAGDPVYLAVYRDREDVVRFMELNPASARLLELVRENEGHSGADLLGRLARELGADPDAILPFGEQQLRQFYELSIVQF